jgi:Flp pilus assembly protein TadB
MNDRNDFQLLVCAAGVVVFVVLVLAVTLRLHALVFLPGGIGSIVALYVLGQRLRRSSASDAAHRGGDV